MKTSARNHFTGKVKDLVKGPVTTEVTIAVADSMDVVATISTRSAESLVACGSTSGPPAAASIARPSANPPIQSRAARSPGATALSAGASGQAFAYPRWCSSCASVLANCGPVTSGST